MTVDLNDARVALAVYFASTASWRREKARECPDDLRNLTAAELLERLAATVSEIDTQTLDAYGALLDDVEDSERHSEMLREIGFHWEPDNALEFVQRFIAETRGA